MRNAKIVPFSSTALMEEVKSLLEDDKFNPLNKDKLPHKVFMEVIATNSMHKTRTDLDYTNPNTEHLIKDCKAVFFDDYMQKRTSTLVYEDNTHKYVTQKYSFDQLKEAISHFALAATESTEIVEYFEQTLEKEPTRVQYFKNAGLSSEEAYCCAFVLSFYTGKAGGETNTSDGINRSTSREVRLGNESLGDDSFYPVMHYMVKALAYIPYYWGNCIRAVKLTQEEISRYEVGSIVAWTQFSSSTLSSQVPEHFSGRNVYFHLYSLTGRNITQFSNFKDEEEVLFSPFSTFLVIKVQRSPDKTIIYMRQVELGLTENTFLWVDDRIFDKGWENKEIMERLTSKGLGRNIHIIPKPSTHLALSFLDSKFGQRLKLIKSFKIISDMKRPDEENGNEAGAIGLKQMRAKGFQQEFIFYTMDENFAKNAIKKHVGNSVDKVHIFTTYRPFIEYFTKCF